MYTNIFTRIIDIRLRTFHNRKQKKNNLEISEYINMKFSTNFVNEMVLSVFECFNIFCVFVFKDVDKEKKLEAVHVAKFNIPLLLLEIKHATVLLPRLGIML